MRQYNLVLLLPDWLVSFLDEKYVSISSGFLTVSIWWRRKVCGNVSVQRRAGIQRSYSVCSMSSTHQPSAWWRHLSKKPTNKRYREVVTPAMRPNSQGLLAERLFDQDCIFAEVESWSVFPLHP